MPPGGLTRGDYGGVHQVAPGSLPAPPLMYPAIRPGVRAATFLGRYHHLHTVIHLYIYTSPPGTCWVNQNNFLRSFTDVFDLAYSSVFLCLLHLDKFLCFLQYGEVCVCSQFLCLAKVAWSWP